MRGARGGRKRALGRETERLRAGGVRVAWSVPRRFLADRAVEAAVRAALQHGGRPEVDVDVALVSDAELAAIHGRFLGDPSATDVISFDLGEEDGGPAGEIYVSVDRAVDVARRRGLEAAAEIRLYLVHGALHLCGFDDHAPRDRVRMRRAESLVLASLERKNTARGGTRDPRLHRKTGKTSPRATERSRTSETARNPAGKRAVSRSRARAS